MATILTLRLDPGQWVTVRTDRLSAELQAAVNVPLIRAYEDQYSRTLQINAAEADITPTQLHTISEVLRRHGIQ